MASRVLREDYQLSFGGLGSSSNVLIKRASFMRVYQSQFTIKVTDAVCVVLPDVPLTVTV
jgi:hypothetical protein